MITTKTGAGLRCDICGAKANMSQPGKGIRRCWKHIPQCHHHDHYQLGDTMTTIALYGMLPTRTLRRIHRKYALLEAAALARLGSVNADDYDYVADRAAFSALIINRRTSN